MTDREIMLHRFSHKNLRKSTGELCKYLGMTRREYEAAVRRGMDEEAREWKDSREKKVEKKEEKTEHVQDTAVYFWP